jgi:hypothetical protein
VNADKSKHIVMSRDQDAGQNHNTGTENKSLERVDSSKCGNNPNESKFNLGCY